MLSFQLANNLGERKLSLTKINKLTDTKMYFVHLKVIKGEVKIKRSYVSTLWGNS